MKEITNPKQLAKNLNTIITQMNSDFDYIESTVSQGDYDEAIANLDIERGNWQEMLLTLGEIEGIYYVDDMPSHLVDGACDEESSIILNKLLEQIKNNIDGLEKMREGINELKQCKQDIIEKSAEIDTLISEGKYFEASKLRVEVLNRWNITDLPRICGKFGLQMIGGEVLKQDGSEATFFEDITHEIGAIHEVEEEIAVELEQEDVEHDVEIESEKLLEDFHSIQNEMKSEQQLDALHTLQEQYTAMMAQQEAAFKNALITLRNKAIDFTDRISKSDPDEKLTQALNACKNIIRDLETAGKTYFNGPDTLSTFRENVSKIILPTSKDVAVLSSHRNPIAETFLAVLKAIGKFVTGQWKNMYELRQTKSAQALGTFRDAFFKDVKPATNVNPTQKKDLGQESDLDNKDNVPKDGNKPNK